MPTMQEYRQLHSVMQFWNSQRRYELRLTKIRATGQRELCVVFEIDGCPIARARYRRIRNTGLDVEFLPAQWAIHSSSQGQRPWRRGINIRLEG